LSIGTADSSTQRQIIGAGDQHNLGPTFGPIRRVGAG
jgi:hypothetical protein